MWLFIQSTVFSVGPILQYHWNCILCGPNITVSLELCSLWAQYYSITETVFSVGPIFQYHWNCILCGPNIPGSLELYSLLAQYSSITGTAFSVSPVFQYHWNCILCGPNIPVSFHWSIIIHCRIRPTENAVRGAINCLDSHLVPVFM